jgi:hypothetical protein
MVVRMNSNSTSPSTGDSTRRSHPDGSRSTRCSVWRSTRIALCAGSSSSRAIDVPSAVASRSSTSTVGVFVPRSTSETMLLLMPLSSASRSMDNPRDCRSPRMRCPSSAMDRPLDRTPSPSIPPL